MVGGISAWQLGILLLIVVLVFGTKRLRNIGGDLGSAVKGFRSGMADDEDDAKKDATQEKLVADPEPEVSATAENSDASTRPPGSSA